MRISDWSSDVCSSDLNPECRPPVPSDERPAAEGEEGEEKARRREGDRQAEDDLDQPAESARGIAEGKAQAGDDDADHRDDLGDRTLDALEDRLERRFPGH